jgi:hypothetical protein
LSKKNFSEVVHIILAVSSLKGKMKQGTNQSSPVDKQEKRVILVGDIPCTDCQFLWDWLLLEVHPLRVRKGHTMIFSVLDSATAILSTSACVIQIITAMIALKVSALTY